MTEPPVQSELEARALNHAHLASCERPHRFVCVQPRGGAGRRAVFQCRTCGGFVGEKALAWYNLGIMDGRKVELRREARREARGEPQREAAGGAAAA